MLSLEELKKMLNSKEFKQETKKNIEREPERIKRILQSREQIQREPELKKRGRPKNIMKGRADIDGNKITTELNIKKGLQPKVKRALKKSVIAELDNKMNGKGLRGRTISLSSSDSD